MKKITLVLASVLFMSIPCKLCADNNAHVIPLTEINFTDVEGGDEPTRDGDSGTDITPINTNGFSAIINGHVLSVAVVDPPQQPNLRVYKADGSLVVNRRFTRTINVHLSDTGYYTLVITIGFQSFQGQFEIVD